MHYLIRVDSVRQWHHKTLSKHIGHSFIKRAVKWQMHWANFVFWEIYTFIHVWSVNIVFKGFFRGFQLYYLVVYSHCRLGDFHQSLFTTPSKISHCITFILKVELWPSFELWPFKGYCVAFQPIALEVITEADYVSKQNKAKSVCYFKTHERWGPCTLKTLLIDKLCLLPAILMSAIMCPFTHLWLCLQRSPIPFRSWRPRPPPHRLS